MITFKEGDIRFNYRIAGFCVHENKLLIHRGTNEPFWTLPGGRAELLEDTQGTITREFLEETGQEILAKRPLWFVENFFPLNGKRYHEVSLIYEVEFINKQGPVFQAGFTSSEPNGQKLIFEWVPVNELSAYKLYPAFLVEEATKPPRTLEHRVINAL